MPRWYHIGTYEGVPKGPGVSKFDFHDYETGKVVRGRNELRYMNANEKTPNCHYELFDCFTMRAIRIGEELTFDYIYGTWYEE